jgi:cobalt-zinc-cadmium efflux system outer membrane protein
MPRPAASAVRFVTLILAFLPALSGCVHYRAEKLEPGKTLAAFEERSLTQSNLQAFLAASDSRFAANSPKWDLDSLTLVAFYYHPNLDVARAQWNSAAAAIGTAKGRPNPTVGLIPGYSFNPPNGVSPWLPSVTYDLPIETAGKRNKRTIRAQQLSTAARLNIVSTAWQVRSAVRASLLDLAAATEREKALQAQLQTQQNILQLMEQRLQAGAVAPSELYPARVSLLRARSDLVDLRRQLADARARLAESLGIPLKAIASTEFAFPIEIPGKWEELASPAVRKEALHARADLLGALADYEAAEAGLRLEIARQYPDIHLGSTYQWDQGENKWQLGVTVEMPLLNRNEGPIAEAEAKRAEAAARFTALQAKAISEVDRATATRDAILGQLKEAEHIVETDRQQLATLEASVKAGAVDRVEVETAAMELRSSELVLLDLKIKAQQALGLLEDALQRPFDSLKNIEVDPKRPAQKAAKK